MFVCVCVVCVWSFASLPLSCSHCTCGMQLRRTWCLHVIIILTSFCHSLSGLRHSACNPMAGILMQPWQIFAHCRLRASSHPMPLWRTPRLSHEDLSLLALHGTDSPNNGYTTHVTFLFILFSIYNTWHCPTLWGFVGSTNERNELERIVRGLN